LPTDLLELPNTGQAGIFHQLDEADVQKADESSLWQMDKCQTSHNSLNISYCLSRHSDKNKQTA